MGLCRCLNSDLSSIQKLFFRILVSTRTSSVNGTTLGRTDSADVVGGRNSALENTQQLSREFLNGEHKGLKSHGNSTFLEGYKNF